MNVKNPVVLIAGPSCCGKSTLARLLVSGRLGHIVAGLGLEQRPGGRTVSAHQLETGRKKLRSRGIQFVHYDTVRFLREHHIPCFEADPVFDNIRVHMPDMVIHMNPEHTVLLEMLADRYRKRRLSPRRLIQPWHENKRLAFLRILRECYEQPEWLRNHTTTWRSFAFERFKCPHWDLHHHGFHRPDWVDYVRLTYLPEPVETAFRSCCSLSG